MAAALGDPAHGYYRTRDPLGASGDFITAPEISQVFGEILGLVLAESWRLMGAPDPVILVELGPGRGTLMADLLRALRVLPACRHAVQVHLVETGPVLRERQRETLARQHPDLAVAWHGRLADVPPGPLLLVANEFFDALPIRQWLRRGDGWVERLVGLDAAEGFVFVDGPPRHPPVSLSNDAEAGAVFETAEPAWAIAAELGTRLTAAPGVALLIDYGHAESAVGETLQAVRAHRYAPVLADPGEADLTAHVDFAALGRALGEAGAAVHGPATQGRFLTDNGAVLRVEALTRGKDTGQAVQLRRGVQRLLDPAGMGRLFKVLGATSPTLPRPPGF